MSRPKHGNWGVEHTLADQFEKTFRWKITFDEAKQVFTVTCARGHKGDIPQHPAPRAKDIMLEYLKSHGDHI